MFEAPLVKVIVNGRQFWLDVERDKLLPVVRGGDGPTEETPAEDAPAEDAPAEETPAEDNAETVDITTLSDEDLAAAAATLEEAFNAYDTDNVSAAELAEMAALADQIEAVRAEGERRVAEAEANRAEAAALQERVNPPPVEGAPVSEPIIESVSAAATVPAEDVLPRGRRLNLSLAEIRARAPEVVIDAPRPAHRVTITAAAEIDGISPGAEFPDVETIARAFTTKAGNMLEGATASAAQDWRNAARAPIMSIKREHAITLADHMTDDQYAELMHLATDIEALVAAGSWCAPSTTLYETFNISSDDGMVDLPTVGLTRGGLKHPTSPTLADFLADVWLWTEADDLAAVTGSPTKPCVRVPCPTWVDDRWDAHGLCVLVGNLTDAAYPEGTVNFIKLLMDAHRHVMNAHHIAQMAAAATAVNLTQPTLGSAANILAGIDLSVVDTRQKFGMSENAVLEVVVPSWAKGSMRSDLARRSGVDLLAVTDAEIAAWFDVRDVRAQFVADYQTRGVGGIGATVPAVAWPATVKVLVYAAGTFALGEGPTISTGAIRDSVLNATNDHTAAWTEETSVVSLLGHEAREVTIDLCADGSTGASTALGCPIA